MPATCWAAPSPAQAFLDFRSVALRSAVQGGVIQIKATLGHHLFQPLIGPHMERDGHRCDYRMHNRSASNLGG
jgi:hypothetical protein